MLQILKKEFVQEYANCNVHGDYAINTQDEHGIVRYYAYKECPKCAKQKIADELFSSALLGKRHQHCTLENYKISGGQQQKSFNQCKNYADKIIKNRQDGRCLILHGNPGTGKNHLATAICKIAMNEGISAKLITASQYLTTFWGVDFNEKENFINEVCNIDLLILDEVARIPDTETARDGLFTLINGRYINMNPTLLIANLTRDELIKKIGNASYERLAEGGGVRVNCDWESYRINGGKND